MKFSKYLPHLGLVALIVFLITDTSPIILDKTSNPEKNINEGSHSEGSHKEGSNGQNLPQEEKEKRMGIFHYNEGNKNFKAGQYDEAITNYKKALHHNKNFKEATINLSTAYMKISNFDKALETLQMGLALDSENPHIHYNYACYYSLTDQPKASLEKLKAAIQFGFNNLEQIKTDSDLEKLRQSPEFNNWSLASNSLFDRNQGDLTRGVDL
ncbi:MAG: tetratricopeptide repeat protein [Nitrospina sp.]|jgi:tetratricopeptide (TPR) repeat protein|nr:tetratricopeptide repeat protein [Nitrospina sp.]MBT6718304.1 tetratricopeptide repeat protein [Nitrospina sp.]